MKNNLIITTAPQNPDTKTKLFIVEAKLSRTQLGEIKWYGPWRRYVFYPLLDSLYDAACLLEIATFIHEQMNSRKKAS